MTKKDFKLIAEVINRWGADYESLREAKGDLINSFADRLELENSSFDRYKFIMACLEV